MSIVIGIVDKISRIAKFTSTTKKGNTLFLHAQEGMDYVVVDKQTGFAPKKIIAIRDGNNLKLFVEGESDPSVIIEDYYLYPAQVIGQTADGSVHNYVPLSASEQEQVGSLEDHQAAVQVLSSEQQAPITWETNDTDWGLITLIAYGLTVAGAMALMITHGGGGDDKKEVTVVNTKALIDDVQDSQEPQTGSVKRGESTNDETPTLLGHLNKSLASGESVIIYRDGVKIGTAKTNGKDWTFEDVTGGLITDRTYTYTARVEHSDGTKGATSDGYDIIFDNSAPTQGVTITDVADDVAPVTGSVANNGYTNDTDPVITGTLTHATEKGEYVVVLRNGVAVGKALVTGTTWTFADTGLADGETYVYTALVKDAAGNTGAISKGYTIHIDTTAPDHLVSIDGVYDDVAPGIGIIGNNGVTNDTTPELRGQIDKALADNETLVIYRDGKKIGDAVVEGTSWHYTDSGLANNTQYKYTAQVEDLAGNTGPGSNDYSININFTGPSQLVAITAVTDDVDPVTGNVAHKGHTNDTKPDVSGTLSAALNNGEVVVVYRDGIKAGEATVTGNTWTYHENLALSDGKHTYTAYVEDAAHNLGAASNSYEITVDTVAPDQTITLTEITDNKDPVTGKIPQGGETNDDTPTLHGKLSSELSAGEVVVIYRNGTKVGIADTDGTQWSFEDAGLASGSKYNYYAQVEDLAGNISQPSNDYNITLNTNGASQSTHILSIMDDQDPVTGNVLNGGYTNDITPTLTGSVTAELSGSEKLIIYRNGTEAGQAIVKGTSWTFTDTLDNSDGHYIYTAAVKDAAGNQGAMSNDYSINVDVTAPTQTAVITHIIDDEGAWQGNVAKDGITDDKTPTVVGTLDAALDKTEMLAVYRNGKLVGTAVVHNKEWAFTDSLANDGSYVYTARVVDKAGNEGHLSGEFGITVDTGFPSQQVTITDIQDDKAPQTGSVANHGFTNDDTPTLHGKLTGELLTGQNVVIFRNGVEVNKAVVNGTDWTFSDSGLTDGNTYLYTAVVRNAAGNTGNISDGYTITMDTSAPNQSVQITTIMDDVAPLIGEVKNGGYTNDTTPQLRGTLSAALGSGEYVVMMRDGVMIGKAQVTGTGWTYDDANLTDGTTYIYTALVRDAAGNSGAVSGNYTINIDTTAPDALVTINTVYDDKEPGIGEIGKGDTTNDTTPELRGDLSKTLAANETLVIYRDGHKVGTADVDGTHWTYTDSGLANNSHYTYTARVEDAAGNLGKDSDKYDIHVKFDGPSQTVAITGVNDDVTPVTGNVAHKGHTNDARPDVTGTLNEAIGAGDVVAVYRDKVKVGVAIVTGTTWTFSESLDLADGKHVYTAYVEDAAHNLGAASNSYEINVDTVAPDQTVTLTEILDNKDPVTGPVQNGGYTNDDTPTLHGTLSSGLTSGEVLVIYRNGVKIGKGVISQDGLGWSYEDSGLASGSDYRYYAQVEDLAGNVSDKSNEHAIKLNTDGASQGTQILNILDDQDPVQGSVASGGHTNDTTPTLTGSVSAALAGTEEVIIFRNGAEVGKATVTGTAWTYTDKVITTDGEYTYTAAVRDATGNQGAESNAYLINLDTTAPSQHVVIEGITDDMEPSVGEIANNGVTNDKTPTLHGQLDGALSATESVHVYRDGKLAGTAKVTGKTWVYTDNLASDGHYEYTAKVVDKAGNEGAVSDKYAMTLDTTAPTQVVTITEIMDDKAPQTGKVDNGGFTNDDTPTLNGKLSAALAAGETVSVYRDNVKIGTATVAEDGLGWSYTDKELKDATTYVYTAYAEDAAGNLGPVSDKYTITTDMTAPTQSVQITTIMDDVAPLIGEVKNGGYTNDTTPQLQGTLSAALGSGEYVVMMRDGVMIGKAQVTGTGWTYDDANLTDGTTYIYTALVRDAAGNSGAVSGNYTINIDTTAPDALVTINTVYDDKEPGIGEIGKGDTTNDTTPELRGDLSKTLAANETLVIYRDGHKVGTADVDGTHWSYTDSGLANNSHYTYTARVEDAAGNLGKDSAAYDIHVKFDGPSQTVAITGVNDDVAPVTGNVAHKGHTNDARPDVTGTLNEAIGAGDVVAVYRDKVKVGVAKVTGTTWTFSESLDLADGKHVYTAYVEDAAHNLGAASNSYEINVDTVAPDQTVTLTEILDNKDPVTGPVQNGGYTNDDTPTLHGTLSSALTSGEVLVIYRNGVKIGKGVISQDGLGWSYEDSGLASGSDYRYYAQVEDLAGNVSDKSNEHAIKLNTDGASQGTQILNILDDQDPVQGSVASGGHTNDTTPTLTGSVSAALAGTEEVIIFRNGAEVGKATVTGTAWSYTDKAITTDGEYTYTAAVRDATGNQGAESNAYLINLDTTAPSQHVVIEGITDDMEPSVGEIANNGVTNDKTPTLHGQLDGTLSATESVHVYRDGKLAGTAKVTGKTWVYTDNLASDGHYEYTAKVVDKAGNEGAVSDKYAMTLDTTAPTQVVTITEIMDDKAPQTGKVDNGGFTNDDTPTLNGKLSAALAAGETVSVYRDNVKIGTATVAEDGLGWSYTDKELKDATTYVYTAYAEDAAGNLGPVSDKYTITTDMTAPTQSVQITTIMDDVAPLIGEVKNGGYTNDTTPQLQGTLSAALGSGEYVVVMRDGVMIGKAQVTGTGWTYDDANLTDGTTYIYTALVRDAAGNSGAVSGNYTINIDTTAPDALVTINTVYDDKEPGIGEIGKGDTTNDTTPELRGDLSKTLAANETLVIYRDGHKVGTADVDGTHWSYTDSGLANNSHYTYTARVEDAAGNLGKDSAAYDIHVKFDGPSQTVAITGVNDDVAPVTGNVAHKGHTNDARPDVTGTLNEAIGAGDVVAVYRDKVKVGVAKVTGTTWTFSESADLADGKHVYTAYVEDAAHNLGAASNSYEINVDTVAPDQTVTLTEILDNKDPVTGPVQNGGYTNDDTPTLHGTLSSALTSGEVLVIYRNGVKIGKGVISQDGLGWSYEDSGLASGSDYRYYAQVEDLAGNVSDKSNEHAIKLNTDGASQGTQILNITDDQDPVQGSVASGGHTNDTTPTLTGSVSAALAGTEEVIIFRNGAEVGKATVTGTAWTYTDKVITTDGEYTYTAAVRDATGNQGAESNAYLINLDTTAPSQHVVIEGITDDMAPSVGEIANGGVTNDKTPTLHGSLDNELSATELVKIYRDGNFVGTAKVTGKSWSYNDKLNNDGTYVYTAKVVDKAGNEGVVSDKYGITLDTVLPTQLVTITDIQDDKAPQLGSVKNGGFTNDDTPTLHGTLNSKLGAGETVSIYRGDSKVGTATVAADGLNWSYTDKGLTDGTTYIYTAYAEDAAGNLGKVSDKYTITMDTTPPAQLVAITDIIDDKDPQTGSVKNGGFTNDDTPTLHGTLNSKLGAGETVSIYRGDSKVGTATVAADGLSWSYTDNGLTDGTTYIYTAYAEDAAGNLGKVSDKYTITMDTTPPAQLVTITDIIDDKDPQTGSVKNGGFTNDDTPTLHGTLNSKLGAGETVSIYRGDSKVGTATVAKDGLSWSYTDNGLTDGTTYIYTAYAEDAAGNLGKVSDKYTITMDSTPPGQLVTITDIIDDKDPQTGSVKNGGFTNDDTPTLHGTLNSKLGAGETVSIYRGDSKVGTATVAKDGLSWSYTDNGLTDGSTYVYTAYAEDAAGNLGKVSDKYTITMDSTPPGQLVTITDIIDDKDPQTGSVKNGGFTNDDTPTLHGTLNSKLGAGETVSIYRG
ncbi:Ig-like domain-containing protein, partial [Morganella psychrotolerans]